MTYIDKECAFCGKAGGSIEVSPVGVLVGLSPTLPAIGTRFARVPTLWCLEPSELLLDCLSYIW